MKLTLTMHTLEMVKFLQGEWAIIFEKCGNGLGNVIIETDPDQIELGETKRWAPDEYGVYIRLKPTPKKTNATSLT